MKKLTILSSAIAFLLLTSITVYSKAMAQYTQNQDSTATEQITEGSTDKSESEQQQKLTNTEQVFEGSTDKSEQNQNSNDTEQETSIYK